MPETLVRFLVWEDPLEKGWATHSSVHGLPGGPVVNDPVPMQETWVSPPVREEPTRYPYASVMESVL